MRTETPVAAFRDTAMTGTLTPALHDAITEQLGENGWELTQDAAASGTLHFAYPKTGKGRAALAP